MSREELKAELKAKDALLKEGLEIFNSDIEGNYGWGVFCKWFKKLEQALKGDKDENLKKMKNTKIICLCGSTRFTDQMLVKQWELTKERNIVLSWCALPESYFKGSHIGDIEGVKEIVDEVHKRKIDLADEVIVINIGGYIGDSTRSEIEYAEKIGVPVKYLEQSLKGG